MYAFTKKKTSSTGKTARTFPNPADADPAAEQAEPTAAAAPATAAQFVPRDDLRRRRRRGGRRRNRQWWQQCGGPRDLAGLRPTVS